MTINDSLIHGSEAMAINQLIENISIMARNINVEDIFGMIKQALEAENSSLEARVLCLNDLINGQTPSLADITTPNIETTTKSISYCITSTRICTHCSSESVCRGKVDKSVMKYTCALCKGQKRKEKRFEIWRKRSRFC